MQISQVTVVELGLLIMGLRAIHVADSEAIRHRLAKQLKQELSTRFGTMVGTVDEQERNQSIG